MIEMWSFKARLYVKSFHFPVAVVVSWVEEELCVETKSIRKARTKPGIR